MKKLGTAAAVVIMLISGFIGLFIGILLNDPVGGIISGILISGIACIIYTINNSDNK